MRLRFLHRVLVGGRGLRAPLGPRQSLAASSGVVVGAGAGLSTLRSQASSCGMFDFDDDGLHGGGFGGGFGSGVGFGSNGRGPAKVPPKVPVSILCGFLGAGKTTIVSHILRNREGLKVGIVVNDVAEANVDSEVLNFEDADGIVGLQNGCACCSGRDDLFARLQELVESAGISKLDRTWDRLVVECSGVAEPESIARELEAMGRRGDPVMKRIFLASIVCVVDASAFWDLYNSSNAGDAERQPLSALLVNQLESADTVIINKTDLVSAVELERLRTLIATLNANARCFEATKGALPIRTLLPAEPVDLDMPAYVPSLANRHSVAVRHAALKRKPPEQVSSSSDGQGDGNGHGHGHGHSHEHDEDCSACAARNVRPQHDRYGLASFVYRCSDRRFDAKRLAAAARQLPVVEADLQLCGASPGMVTPAVAFDGVLRSKGFVHIAGSEASYYWSHAGQHVKVTESPGAPCKGQEIVFIGIGMKEDAITAALDGCLVSRVPEPAL